jgi:phosphate transport system substrate-binding protein
MKYMIAIPSPRPRWSPILGLTLVVALTLAACAAPAGGGPSGSPVSLVGRYRVSGGGGTIPVLTAVTNRFAELHPGVLWDIENVGSDAAIASVKSAEADLGGVSREMTAAELASVQTLQIGVSGTAVAVNAANTVGNLTKAQVRAIFAGDINDWSQVGGTPGEIRVFVREATAATRVIFDDYIFANKPAYRSDFTPVDSADQTTKAITSFKDAVSMLTITDATLANTAIKLLPMDGVAPTIDNLTSGKYVMRRPLYMVYSKDKLKPAIAALVDFTKSPEGQKIITGK